MLEGRQLARRWRSMSVMELGSRGLGVARQKLAASCTTSSSTPISPPSSCSPGASPGIQEHAQRQQSMLIGHQSAVKMSFIQKRGLSTLIPPKVRHHIRPSALAISLTILLDRLSQRKILPAVQILAPISPGPHTQSILANPTACAPHPVAIPTCGPDRHRSPISC